MTNYVYVRSEPGLWTVGYYKPDGKWDAESDHDSPDKAAERAALLNGSVMLQLSELRAQRTANQAELARLRDANAVLTKALTSATEVIASLHLFGHNKQTSDVNLFAVEKQARAALNGLTLPIPTKQADDGLATMFIPYRHAKG